jgi:hypothetical protein
MPAMRRSQRDSGAKRLCWARRGRPAAPRARRAGAKWPAPTAESLRAPELSPRIGASLGPGGTPSSDILGVARSQRRAMAPDPGGRTLAWRSACRAIGRLPGRSFCFTLANIEMALAKGRHGDHPSRRRRVGRSELGRSLRSGVRRQGPATIRSVLLDLGG